MWWPHESVVMVCAIAPPRHVVMVDGLRSGFKLHSMSESCCCVGTPASGCLSYTVGGLVDAHQAQHQSIDAKHDMAFKEISVGTK